MRSPIEFEKGHNYDRCRDSIDSDFSSSDHERAAQEDVREDEIPLTPKPPAYSAFSLNRRRFILGLVTATGFFGPLTGAVYLPSLVLFQDIFKVSATAINATVSVYMVVFAIAVSLEMQCSCSHH
jgi:hypothetical protein